jgi:hypothetical protein
MATTTQEKNLQHSDSDVFVRDFLQKIIASATQSKDFHDAGVNDAMAEGIKNLYEAPINFIKGLDLQVSQFAHDILKHIFAIHRDKIHSVYRFESDALFYGVFLKDDNFENSYEVMETIRQIKNSWIGKRNKIVVRIIDLEFEDHLESGEKINLEDAQLPSKISKA